MAIPFKVAGSKTAYWLAEELRGKGKNAPLHVLVCMNGCGRVGFNGVKGGQMNVHQTIKYRN